MIRALAGSLCAVALLTGCAGDDPPEAKDDDIGAQTARIANDTEVLQEAQQAVNTVVRNSPDCDAAKTSMEEANRKLEEAAGKVQTATGRTTLEAMRQQVRRVAELCP